MRNPGVNQAFNHLLSLSIILIISIIVYYPSLNGSFLNWDDNLYIVDNYLLNVKEWKNIIQMFTSSFEGHYHPFTLLSLAFDKIAGNNQPFTFHLHNLILHLINTALVYLFCFLLIQKLNNQQINQEQHSERRRTTDNDITSPVTRHASPVTRHPFQQILSPNFLNIR